MAHIERTDTIYGLLTAAIAYLEQTQEQEDTKNRRFRGEWPGTVNCEANTYIGKKGKSNYDSNAFSAEAVLNILSEAYYRATGLEDTVKIMDAAAGAVARFGDGRIFGFWHNFPLPFLVNGKQIETTQPSEFKLEFSRTAGIFSVFGSNNNILYAAANLACDLDVTALAYTALYNYSLVKGEFDSTPIGSENIGHLFGKYRNLPGVSDEYLRSLAGQHSLGAFLTWFGNDAQADLMPDMTFTVKYLPYGSNDTDCVVNANVLNALAVHGELDAPGVVDACAFVNDSFMYGEQGECGVYYPSPYNLHYVAARAYYNGATCLEPAVRSAIEDILINQNKDGSWSSAFAKDDVHTSLYALNALLYSNAIEDLRVKTAIQKGLDYIARTATPFGSTGKFWEGGVMFSAGKQNLRKDIVWRSDAYTTALAVEAFSLYLYLDI